MPVIRQTRTPADTRSSSPSALHWNRSGFSAHSPVCRNAILAFVLAALVSFSAIGSPALQTKAHTPPSARPASHRSASKARSRKAHSTSKSHSRSTSRTPKAAARHRGNSHSSLRSAAAARRSRRSPKREVSLTRGRIALPPPLRGSYASLVRQNERTEDDNLERILDDQDLSSRIAHGLLVPVPASSRLTVNPSLPPDRRYCRPWTARFLADLARAHAAAFHQPLEVSSAVRTVAYQKQLIKVNGNATSAEGDIVSPHVTGATVDIAKRGMGRRELAWLRGHLLTLQNAGKIDVEEEFQQACFHITVYRSYTAHRPAPSSIPSTPSGSKRAHTQPVEPDPDTPTQQASHGR